MSDTSQGEGWWLASDGKWYPPQSAQGGAPNPPPPSVVYVQKPKKPAYKRVWFWLVIIVVLGMGGCTAAIIGGGAAIDHAAHLKHTVVYSVTGTGTADITYATVQSGSGQNGESQETNVSLPWTKTITASGLFTAFDVSGTAGQNGGTVTCTITEDGNQVATNTAHGAFATADCNATGK